MWSGGRRSHGTDGERICHSRIELDSARGMSSAAGVILPALLERGTANRLQSTAITSAAPTNEPEEGPGRRQPRHGPRDVIANSISNGYAASTGTGRACSVKH